MKKILVLTAFSLFISQGNAMNEVVNEDLKENVLRSACEDENLVEELFFGEYKPELKDQYFAALEKQDSEYNQAVSSAALFLGQNLEQESDKAGALKAYAYAYYYDAHNENIPNYAMRYFASTTTTSKNEFINNAEKKIHEIK